MSDQPKTKPGKQTLTQRLFARLAGKSGPKATAVTDAQTQGPRVVIGSDKLSLGEVRERLDKLATADLADAIAGVATFVSALRSAQAFAKFPQLEAHALLVQARLCLPESAEATLLLAAVEALEASDKRLADDDKRRLRTARALLVHGLGQLESALDALAQLLGEPLPLDARRAAARCYFRGARRFDDPRKKQARTLYAAMQAQNSLYDRDAEIRKILNDATSDVA